MLSEDVTQLVIGFQRNEITEHLVYRNLAAKATGKNAEILAQISQDELRHYHEWKEYTHTEVPPNRLAVWKYLLFAFVFGLTFVMKIMEAGEEQAQVVYDKVSAAIPAAKRIFQEEQEHETLLIAMIDETRLTYISSMVQGLNDALIELVGELAGFTFAFQNPQVIGFAGLIAGIAQFLSSSASEIEMYLSQRTAAHRQLLWASFYEGSVYLLTVLLLVIPYFLLASYHVALAVTIVSTVLVIVVFTFYVSVVKNLALRPMFLTMVTLTLGVGVVSFVIGWIAKIVLNLWRPPRAFPFDFACFADALPEFLRFLVQWISNDIARVLLGLYVIVMGSAAVYAPFAYEFVRKKPKRGDWHLPLRTNESHFLCAHK